jgi:hypothetical protein
VGLGGALAGSWVWFRHLALTAPQPQAPPVEPPPRLTPGPVTPLLLQYKLDLPGRGEIFPAMSAAARDYWPLAVLTVSNTSERPTLQVVSARVEGWSQTQQQTLVLGPGEMRTLKLAPELLPRAYGNSEVRRAMLQVSVSGAERETSFAQTRPVLLHPGSDLYWGEKFANAQFVARWVTPHDPAVLQLISDARRFVPRGRLGGYNISPRAPASALPAQVKLQARAVFRALQRSGISFVSSIYTFGNYAGEAQRIRLPRETLSLRNANCIDVSVVFASAMENLGMEAMALSCTAVDLEQDADGNWRIHTVAAGDKGARSCSGWIELSAGDIDVDPGQSVLVAVTVRTPAIVKTPPRFISGFSGTLRNSSPFTPSMP